jgi:hypothetical protein
VEVWVAVSGELPGGGFLPTQPGSLGSGPNRHPGGSFDGETSTRVWAGQGYFLPVWVEEVEVSFQKVGELGWVGEKVDS